MSFETFLQSAGAGSAAGAIVAGLIIKLWGSYITEKGKNLATKEDIGEITTKLEEAKQPFFELQQQIKASHQLRFAAIDRRLEAHQKAFIAWMKMMNAIHTERVVAAVIECKEFWQHNCLYLDPQVRDALTDAIFAADIHKSYIEAKPRDEEGLNKNWEKIMTFPKILFEAVKLTPISPDILEEMRGNKSSK